MEYRNDTQDRVILVAVQASAGENAEESLDELEELVQTAGGCSVGRIIQNREAIHPGTYVGKGKIEEIRSYDMHCLTAHVETVAKLSKKDR